VVCPDQGIEVWNYKDKQTFVNTAGLTENMTHYCPGCTHGVVHRLTAEVLDELGLLDRAVGIAPVGCSVLAYEYFNIDMFEAAHGRAGGGDRRQTRQTRVDRVHLPGRR
jgi:pyruvate/2-oxoacid:ferredoxin oxidoreductase beta subunit